jgi:Flp pilus assembly protein TadB
MIDRYRFSRPVFFAIWLVLIAAFVVVIVTSAPVILIAVIALANLALLPFMPRRHESRRGETPVGG